MDQIGLTIGGRDARFTIIERGNCVLVEGALPADWLAAITKLLPKKAIISPALAHMMGAHFAFGLAADVDALIASITPAAEVAARLSAASRGLSEAAAVWLASGERGNSSETMFTHLIGVNANRGSGNSHPYEPGDLRRCRLLLEQVPELAPKFPEMAKVSKTWARLVRDWDLICSMMDKEFPTWRSLKKSGSCPETYKLIKLSLGE